VEATARLYAWARGAGARHVVHASTVSVLRPRVDVGEPLNDWSPQVEAPAHPYALTKAWAEDVAVGLRGAVEAVTLVRPASVYGQGQGESGTVARIARTVAAGETIELAGPEGHRFTPVFIDDVVEALLWSLRNPRDATFSVGGPEALSEREVAEELGRWLGRPPAFAAGGGIARMFGVSSARLDALFPDRPRTPWRDGMRRTWPLGSERDEPGTERPA
jgi:nucleoside-diphosphate-sugar epimerase